MTDDDNALEPATTGSEAAVAAVAGLVNPALGVAAAAAFGVKDTILQQRWRTAIGEAVRTTGKLLDPEDPVTVAVFTKLSLAAAQTADTAKLKLLVNAALNAGSDGVDPAYLQEHFADLIARLSALHVRVLRAVRDHNDLGLDLTNLNTVTLLRGLERDGEGEIDPDVPLVLDAVWNELITEGLVEGAGLALETSFDTDPPRGHQVNGPTEKGKRFLRYLRRHPNA